MIGIPVKSNCGNPDISDRFARSNYFAIIEEGKILYFVENICKKTPFCVGKVAVKLLMANGVTTIIAPHIGSTTTNIIKSYSLKVFDSGESTKLSEVLNNYKSNNLINITSK